MEPSRQTVFCDHVAEARGSSGPFGFLLGSDNMPSTLEAEETIQVGHETVVGSNSRVAITAFSLRMTARPATSTA